MLKHFGHKIKYKSSEERENRVKFDVQVLFIKISKIFMKKHEENLKNWSCWIDRL